MRPLSPLELLQNLPAELRELNCEFEPAIQGQYKCVVVSGQSEDLHTKAVGQNIAESSIGSLQHIQTNN